MGMKKNDEINSPAHYAGKYECIDIIEYLGLGYRLGNTLKYIWRAGKKGHALTDLRKARWYLDREISKLAEAEGRTHNPQPSVEGVRDAIRVAMSSAPPLPEPEVLGSPAERFLQVLHRLQLKFATHPAALAELLGHQSPATAMRTARLLEKQGKIKIEKISPMTYRFSLPD